MTVLNPLRPGPGPFDLHEILFAPSDSGIEVLVDSKYFKRTIRDLPSQAKLVVDEFPDENGASCCFLRMQPGEARTAGFIVQGAYKAESCPSGGWLLIPLDSGNPFYWIPLAPVARTLDSRARILSENAATITGFSASATELTVEINVPDNVFVDIPIWHFLPEADRFLAELLHPLQLETQPVYLWNSQTRYSKLADIYLYLVHGHVYTNRFIWPRMWKICSELDAYTLYVALDGLELATGKYLYNLLKRQLLFSVITRQDKDGGWYHGEWTDRMESHYRFHNGALLLLEAGMEEWPDPLIRNSLERGASFVSHKKDETDLGTWFLHDSLEDSPALMDELCKQTGSRWVPNRIFGKSPTNKLILNTHLDTIVALDRYRQVTADNRFAGLIESARSATKSVLDMRPAELLYTLVYKAIGLTLLPAKEAERLPFIHRAIKRLTWMYLTPKLYRIKMAFPRFVMPGGLIERHLSMPHCDFNYPAVNVMDLARYWRRFPDEDLGEILNTASRAVAGTSIMKYWAEVKQGNRQQFAVVVWVEAMYNMCTLRDDSAYRRYLAEAILCAEEAELGLPPCLLGADHEVVQTSHHIPCPSPADNRLRIANLSREGKMEILVINGSVTDLSLEWEKSPDRSLSWCLADSQNNPISDEDTPLSVPARGWLWGREN